jgi:DNA-binding MarR family transcriptional regulator
MLGPMRRAGPSTVRSRKTESTYQRGPFTEVVLEIFRLNGALIAAGNALCEGTGLTSARWQVLGALAVAGEPRTVAQIARAMGLTRQAVQRLVDELEAEGVVARLDHPESRRARLVRLTARGESLFAEMVRRQRPWAARIGAGMSPDHLQSVLGALRLIRTRLETESDN